MAHQLVVYCCFYGASQQDETKVRAKMPLLAAEMPSVDFKMSTEVRQRVDSHQSHWTQCCGLES